MATKPVLRADAAAPPPNGEGDIRSARPYFLSARPVRAVVRRLLSIAALVTIDVCGLALGLYLALMVRELYREGLSPFWNIRWDALEQWLPFLTLITILVFWRAGLYAEREQRAGVGRIVSSLVLVVVITLAFAWGVGHEFHTYGLAPTAVVLTTVIISLLRGSYDRVTGELLRLGGVRRHAALVGTAENVARLRRALGSARGGIEYEFVGTIAPEEVDGIGEILGRTEIDELIVNAPDLGERELLELVEEAHRGGVKVRIAPATVELLTQRGEYVAGQGVPLFELRPPVFAGVDWAVKRTFDLVVSLVAVVAGLPLWLAIAAAVKLTSPGPVFYRDRRIGLGEREFAMLKFRTMAADAAARRPQLEDANEADGALFKIRHDPRVTRVGAVLRRFSLDEIPQLLHVIRGDMSLVGPRPLPVSDVTKLEPWHRKRHLVLPGMTGLWQISGRSELSFDDLVRLDFYYLENWSIWLDITILVKTIPAVIAKRGAY